MAKQVSMLGNVLGFCGEVATKLIVTPTATGICGGNETAGRMAGRAAGKVGKIAGEFVGDTVSNSAKTLIVLPLMIYGGLKEGLKTDDNTNAETK